MDKKNAQERIEKLKSAINHHRYLYHVLDRQEISDAALDSLKKELFDLEALYPDLITKDSPTQRVGGKPLKEFKKIRHKERMNSLNDVFSKEDFDAWITRISKLLTEEEKNRLDFYCELKIDGLAIELQYENGILKNGSTRGDGLMGEDITLNLKTIEAIPLILQETRDKRQETRNLTVRGEVFISKKEFEAVNAERREKRLPIYANPRNIAAGSIRQLDPKVTASRKLDFFAYEIVENLGPKTHEEKHWLLKELGFKTNILNKLCKSKEEVFSFYEKAAKSRESLDYEIDGVVVIINNNKIFEHLGIVGKAPRGTVAFKFAQSEATTVVYDILLQVGRTGAITPVAVLKPVKVSGITITRATLHNEDEIKRLSIKIGDTVIVGRAGDVIPNIIKVLVEMRTGREKNFKMPGYCPSCGTKLQKLEGEAILKCPNSKCFARKRRNFYHFVSRPAFDIRGLGPKIVDRLIDEGLASDPGDIFSLKEEDLSQLERFGEKSALNLVKSIKEKKRITLPKFIYALGIRNVGEETAFDLARRFGSTQKIREANLEDLESIMDVGPVVAKSIYEWFNDRGNLNFLEKIFKAGVKIEGEEKKGKNTKLSGKIFVLTGSLESIGREEAKEKIRELGGEVSESVSKKISYVIRGNEPGGKLEKAEQLGLAIIGEKEFLNLIR